MGEEDALSQDKQEPSIVDMDAATKAVIDQRIEEVVSSLPDAGRISHLAGQFRYEHLPDHLQLASKPFGDLAQKIIAGIGLTDELADIARDALAIASRLCESHPGNPDTPECCTELAQTLAHVTCLPINKERALRHILKAKDCGVRAVIPPLE